MKSIYFTKENIEEKSNKILSKINELVHVRDIPFSPERSALVVMDMQRYFLEEKSHAFIPSANAIIPQIRSIAQEYYRKNLPVIFTQHINSPENAQSMKKWWKDLIREDSPLREITKEIDTSKGYLIKKTQYDAFYKTPLEDLLRELKVEQLIITGVMTNLCCETTARSAFMRGFDVFFAVDGTATYNEDLHFSSILNLAFGFAIPILVKGILKKVEKYED